MFGHVFITYYTEIFVEKMKDAFAMQKFLTFFFNKNNIGIFQKLSSENLTKR